MIPSLFIAHGAPLLAIQNNAYTEFLEHLGTSIVRPQAIVLFSAHYVGRSQQVGTVRHYDTIYDFGGFPDALYQIKYPAPGSPELAEEVAQLVRTHGVDVALNPDRGLDHGAWVVLRLLYPDADIPVISMSVNPNLSPTAQYQIGQALHSLRERDVLIIGSGGTVHNLRAVNMMGQEGAVDAWALAFDEWLESALKHWDLEALFRYDELAPHANLAVPPYGNEHFVPIFYAMGAADQNRTATLLHRSYQYGNLSHSVWQFG